jgi:hypothetical protein
MRVRLSPRGKLQLQYGTSGWTSAKKANCLWCDAEFVTRVHKPNNTCGKKECRYRAQSKSMKKTLSTYKRCPYCHRDVRVGRKAAQTFKHCGDYECIVAYRKVWKDEFNKQHGHGNYGPHGAIRYWHGCRCDICRAGHTERVKQWLERKKNEHNRSTSG